MAKFIWKPGYQYETFNYIEEYQKPVETLKKEDFFNKLKNKCPSEEQTHRTKEIIILFNFENREQSTKLYCKGDLILLSDVFESFFEVSINEIGNNPLYCVSLPGYTWQVGLKYTDIRLQTVQDKDMILLIKNNIRGCISSVMSNRYVKSDDKKKMLYIDSKNRYGHSMSQPLPYIEIKIDN